jgi:peptidoglycan/xylan/chitin deacetylase (PgdA/CDA1 family)
VGRELIVNFHGLGEPPGFVDSEEKIYWLPIINFTCLLDQILARQPTAEPKVAITFDDGNSSDALLALPELVKRGLTASFFVCAGRIGKQHYLDEVMIKDLLAAGMRVGSHGMDHLDWRELDSAGLDREIGQARRKLEDVIQQPVTTVAILFGSYNRRVLKRLACETWDTIYTVDGGIADCASKVKTRVTVEARTQYRDLVQNLLCPPQLHVQLRRALVLLWKQLR